MEGRTCHSRRSGQVLFCSGAWRACTRRPAATRKPGPSAPKSKPFNGPKPQCRPGQQRGICGSSRPIALVKRDCLSRTWGDSCKPCARRARCPAPRPARPVAMRPVHAGAGRNSSAAAARDRKFAKREAGDALACLPRGAPVSRHALGSSRCPLCAPSPTPMARHFLKMGGWLRPYHVKPGEFRCLAGACPRFFTRSDYGLRTTDLFKKNLIAIVRSGHYKGSARKGDGTP